MGKGSEPNSDQLVEYIKSSSHGFDFLRNQATLMENKSVNKFYSWDEVSKHQTKESIWIVVNDNVYDVTKFKKIHPGGERVINFYAGQDATEVFNAFHKDFEKVYKRSKIYHIGKINRDEIQTKSSEGVTVPQEELKRREEIKNDFSNLRQVANDMGFFKPNYLFFLLHGFHILFLQYLGYYLVWYHGQSSMIATLVALICNTIAMSQAGWAQHDYGHSSMLAKPNLNKHIQRLFVGIVKGASAGWWNFMHFSHHSKPNVINKDPDVRIDPIFVLGEIEPIRKAQKMVSKNLTHPYSYAYQHYIFPLAAPLLFPIYFTYTTIKYAVSRREYWDIISMVIMYSSFLSVIISTYGLFYATIYYFLVRLTESAWFTWVSQCNHIVMDIHDDDAIDTWLNLQIRATCNLEHSFFNDWFTGHLNFQIEHHLFPTMPRHNFYKLQPLVQSLCKKHNIPYIIKPMGQAFLDIILSLKKSGAMWEEAYEELKSSN